MIVVTGGAGFIGSALASELSQKYSEKLLIVDEANLSDTKKNNLCHINNFEYMDADTFIDQISGDQFSESIKAIFHQGACSSTTEMNLEYLRKNNTEYTQILAEWSTRHDVYFSYASSAATYGNGEFGYSDSDELNTSLKPLNPYGQSKLNFDLWAIKNSYHKLITGFRYFNVYGPNEYHKDSMRSMVHKGYEQIKEAEKIKLFKSYKEEYPDGGQKRDFIYIKDVIDCILWFYEHPEIKGIYNLGTGQAQTWNELATAIFNSLDKEVNIEYIEMPDSIKNQYQYFTQADLDKLRSAGCPTQFRDLETGVADYVKNYLESADKFL